MGIPGTIEITGLLAPSSGSDTYAIFDTVYGIDGLRSVVDHPTRDGIPTPRRRQGMIVYTQNDQTYWQMAADLVTWTPWSGSGGNSRTFSWILGCNSDVVASTDQSNWVICDQAGTFFRWDLVAKTGPVGAALILDFLLSVDGGSTFTSLWASNPGNRPMIADGQRAGSGTSFDTTVFSVGNIIRQDTIQIGSTTAGSNLTAAILGG